MNIVPKIVPHGGGNDVVVTATNNCSYPIVEMQDSRAEEPPQSNSRLQDRPEIAESIAASLLSDGPEIVNDFEPELSDRPEI